MFPKLEGPGLTKKKKKKKNKKQKKKKKKKKKKILKTQKKISKTPMPGCKSWRKKFEH